MKVKRKMFFFFIADFFFCKAHISWYKESSSVFPGAQSNLDNQSPVGSSWNISCFCLTDMITAPHVKSFLFSFKWLSVFGFRLVLLDWLHANHSYRAQSTLLFSHSCVGRTDEFISLPNGICATKGYLTNLTNIETWLIDF